MGANRPPSEGVEYRLGSSIIKTAFPPKIRKISDFRFGRMESGFHFQMPSNKDPGKIKTTGSTPKTQRKLAEKLAVVV
jgi:hypothetical protein